MKVILFLLLLFVGNSSLANTLRSVHKLEKVATKVFLSVDEYKHNALHRAAKKGDLSLVNYYVVDRGMEIDADVLALSISSGNADLVEKVLEYNNELVNRLLIEFMEGKDSVVTKIFGPIGSYGTRYRSYDSRMKAHAVADAFIGLNEQENQQRIHKMIVEAINERDLPEFSNTALDSVSNTLADSEPDLIDFFINRQMLSLDYSSADGYHDRIISQAVKKFNLPVVKKMLSLARGERGIPNINYLLREIAGNEIYLTRKEIKKIEEKRILMMGFLIELGADVNLVNDGIYKHGATPLGEAIKSIQPSRVEFLLNHGAVSNNIKEDFARIERHVEERIRSAQNQGYKFDSTLKDDLSAIREILIDKELL